jgi:hypothetical protein
LRRQIIFKAWQINVIIECDRVIVARRARDWDLWNRDYCLVLLDVPVNNSSLSDPLAAKL